MNTSDTPTEIHLIPNNPISKMTREEALKRFKAAKLTKFDAVTALEQEMKQAYEERTGLKANYVMSL